MKKLMSARCFAVALVMVALLGLCVAGCAPQGGGKDTPSADKEPETAQVDWSLQTDCATCHESNEKTMNDETMGACVHAQQAQATCSTCHTDEAGLAKAHEGKAATDPMPKRLKATTVDAETCQNAGCHDLGKDEMLALTAENTELIDTSGTQVNPHNVMGLTPGHADIACGDCHSMHAEKTPPATTCVACHHSGVYECNTCH